MRKVYAPRIDWKQVWGDFNEWYQKDRRETCPACKRYDSHEPDWDAQAKAIQRIVTKHLTLSKKAGK